MTPRDSLISFLSPELSLISSDAPIDCEISSRNPMLSSQDLLFLEFYVSLWLLALK